jgi:hypothetical protein
MSLDFYQTVGGRQFIDGTMKDIARSLERIAESLERMEIVVGPEEEQLCGTPTEEEWREDMKKHPHRDNHMD